MDPIESAIEDLDMAISLMESIGSMCMSPNQGHALLTVMLRIRSAKETLELAP